MKIEFHTGDAIYPHWLWIRTKQTELYIFFGMNKFIPFIKTIVWR